MTEQATLTKPVEQHSLGNPASELNGSSFLTDAASTDSFNKMMSASSVELPNIEFFTSPRPDGTGSEDELTAVSPEREDGSQGSEGDDDDGLSCEEIQELKEKLTDIRPQPDFGNNEGDGMTCEEIEERERLKEMLTDIRGPGGDPLTKEDLELMRKNAEERKKISPKIDLHSDEDE